MRLFWKRRRDDVPSVRTVPGPSGSPSTITITRGRYAGSYANDAIVTYSGQRTTTPRFFNGLSTTSTTLQPERYSKVSNTRNYEGVTVEAIAADDAAAAVVRYQGLEAYGSAKRNKNERKNADTGLDLAIGRAFKNLGRKMERRGLDRIGD